MMRFAALAISFLALCLPAAGWAQNRPPVANAGPDQSIYTGDIAYLNGTAVSPDGAAIVAWSWAVIDAPAGSTFRLDDSDRAAALFVPYTVGDYILSLSVVDANANFSAPDLVTVHAADNIPPVAVATADRTTVPVGGTVCFDGSQSSDPEGGPLSYYWNYGDGSPEQGGASACHAFQAVGTFDVTLTAVDERNAFDTDTVDITVLPPAVVPTLPRSGLWLLGLLLSLAGAAQISRRVEGKA